MKEHNWLMSVIADLSAYADDQKIVGLVEGLQVVVHEYAKEAELGASDKAALMRQLAGSNKAIANI
ncbi:hypothetical protein ACOTTU_00005 [Roseobacter sp. EG26]|uniref:hypothetical protein n=1 Tax=Roseobacter sp. EG26 TaxID=3412477 RepID=UPI003CE48234